MHKRILCFILAVILVLPFSACNQDKVDESSSKDTSYSQSESETELPYLEYSIYKAIENGPTFADEKDDIMIPIIKEKFNIGVSATYYNQGMSMRERINLFIAANDLPDVIHTINENVTVPATGRYAELGELIKENCPNLMRWYPEEEWKDTLYNGRMYVFPALFMDGSHPEFKDDLFVEPFSNWAGIWTKESILTKLGYEFTPIDEIRKKINETQQKPTAEDFAISPAIETPDDFYNFLKRVKEEIPAVDGREIIPFTMPIWLIPHFGATFGLTGNWKFNPDSGKVSQHLGDPNARAYWEFMNKLYNDGLLDKDFAIQQMEQIQEKAIQGRLAASMWFPDGDAVQAAIREIDPNDSLRQIPLPVAPETTFVGIDGVSKATFKFFINKDFEDIPRLLRYFDWFLTEEAQFLRTWGPEDLGLWEMKDGVRVWKDEDLENALRNNDAEYLRANYYSKGLGSGLGEWGGSSIIFGAAPLMTVDFGDWRRSYPYEISESNHFFQAGYISGKGIQWDGLISSPIDDITQKAVDFTYGEFQAQHSAKLFAAKTQAEFDSNWKEVYEYFMDRMNYEEAKEIMEMHFKAQGFDVR